MDIIPALNKRLHSCLYILFFLVISFAFCFPLLKDLHLSCRGDWDFYLFLHEIPSISVFEYGQFPLWNPYCGGGIPLLGNPQLGFPSPIFLVTALFGVVAGLKIAVWLHTFLGMWGMWLLSGYMGVRGPARLAPSFIFIFSGSWVLHLAEGHMVWLSAAFLPLFFLSFMKGIEKRRWLLACAIFESLMFYEGGTYVFAFSILFVCVYALCSAVERKNWQPVIAFTAVNIIAAALSAPKLIPVFDLLVSNPRPMGAGNAISWDDYLFLLIDRHQSLNVFGSWEYGSYLGLTVIVFYLCSLSMYKKHRALVLASVFMFLVSLGNFAAFSPWKILHGLPFWRYFQMPTRSMIVVCFSVALLVGLFLGRPARKGDRLMPLVIGVIVAFIGVDLFLVNSRIFAEAPQPDHVSFFSFTGGAKQNSPKLYYADATATTGLWRSVSSVHQPFSQIRVPDMAKFAHGAWSDQYLPLLQNKGVVDAYETIPFESHARAITDNNYKGEFYLLKRGKVDLLKWSPNKFAFHVKSQEQDRLVINQNFWPGWHASRGVLTRQEGLLAVDLPSGEYDVTVSYLPSSFLIGICIFFVTVSGIIAAFLVLGNSKGTARPEPAAAFTAKTRKRYSKNA